MVMPGDKYGLKEKLKGFHLRALLLLRPASQLGIEAARELARVVLQDGYQGSPDRADGPVRELALGTRIVVEVSLATLPALNLTAPTCMTSPDVMHPPLPPARRQLSGRKPACAEYVLSGAIMAVREALVA